jgi:large subunit ribosomal protein L4
MPELIVYHANGTPGEAVSLSDAVFGGTPNVALLHQAVKRQLANARQGTHDTLTRGEVNRTTKKAWRQKGTGRARQGSRKAPHWTGGGVVFGPHPRDHRVGFPRKMRAAAVRSALASKTAAGQLVLIERFVFEAPSTKQLNQLLATLGQSRRTLLMLEGPQPNVQLSARNLPRVTAATTENVNAYDLLRHDRVVMTLAAARRLEARYTGTASDMAQSVAPDMAQGDEPAAGEPAAALPAATVAATTVPAATMPASAASPEASER